jgi:hypothetical protein
MPGPIKIKKTDNATTIPNRLTFPQGTFLGNLQQKISAWNIDYNKRFHEAAAAGNLLGGDDPFFAPLKFTQKIKPVDVFFNGTYPTNYSTPSQMPADFQQLQNVLGAPASTPALPMQPFSFHFQPGSYQPPQPQAQPQPNPKPFLQQQRWDPEAKKYVSIGRLLKQGKLDLQGNWHPKGKRPK